MDEKSQDIKQTDDLEHLSTEWIEAENVTALVIDNYAYPLVVIHSRFNLHVGYLCDPQTGKKSSRAYHAYKLDRLMNYFNYELYRTNTKKNSFVYSDRIAYLLADYGTKQSNGLVKKLVWYKTISHENHLKQSTLHNIDATENNQTISQPVVVIDFVEGTLWLMENVELRWRRIISCHFLYTSDLYFFQCYAEALFLHGNNDKYLVRNDSVAMTSQSLIDRQRTVEQTSEDIDSESDQTASVECQSNESSDEIPTDFDFEDFKLYLKNLLLEKGFSAALYDQRVILAPRFALLQLINEFLKQSH